MRDVIRIVVVTMNFERAAIVKNLEKVTVEFLGEHSALIESKVFLFADIEQAAQFCNVVNAMGNTSVKRSEHVRAYDSSALALTDLRHAITAPVR